MERVQVCARPSWVPKAQKSRGAKVIGIRYENRAHSHFAQVYGDRYVPGVWFSFSCAGERRVCQVDGIVFDVWQGRLMVLEMKYRHTAGAWSQLYEKYIPVVTAAFSPQGEFEVVGCEVCHWFDPAVQCPQPPRVYTQLQGLKAGEFNVYCWRQ